MLTNMSLELKLCLLVHRIYLKIEPRLQNAKTVVGTRSHHRFIALADNKLRMHRLSMDQIGTVVQVGAHMHSV